MTITQIETGYLETPYLENPYLGTDVIGYMGQQVNFVVGTNKPVGMQCQIIIVDVLEALGQQAEFTIRKETAFGQQAEFTIRKETAFGQQAEFTIRKETAFGQQAEFTIRKETAFGQQAEFIRVVAYGMQSTITLYNTHNLRILCNFPSRGLSSAVGLNTWGHPAGQGQNWKSNSTALGDFSPFNLNTDIVEETWRSSPSAVSGISLDCDTERPQGVFLDTFAMLNHNLTTSASVTLIGSNSSTFAVIGIAIPLEVREGDPNTYYIAPTLPNQGFRYWRIAINDNSNPNDHLEIGTIVFGATSLFVGECFVDQVEFQLKDYTDSVQTEGFTNVNNSRALKKILRLEFRSLSFLRSNFRLMRGIFRKERTVLKCLWIPTPSAINQEYTARFALFAKLVQIPTESHNHKGGDADYVSFSIELDESK